MTGHARLIQTSASTAYNKAHPRTTRGKEEAETGRASEHHRVARQESRGPGR
jgi:hypothetical protein